MSYAEIEKRVNLSIEHYKKPCLHGDCEQDGDSVIRCDRHTDTAAIVRRYIRMEKFKKSLDEQSMNVITALSLGQLCIAREIRGENNIRFVSKRSSLSYGSPGSKKRREWIS